MASGAPFYRNVPLNCLLPSDVWHKDSNSFPHRAPKTLNYEGPSSYDFEKRTFSSLLQTLEMNIIRNIPSTKKAPICIVLQQYMATPSIAALYDEYCPPLDSALVQALLLDYNEPLEAKELETLRTALKTLAAEAQSDVNLKESSLDSSFNHLTLDSSVLQSDSGYTGTTEPSGTSDPADTPNTSVDSGRAANGTADAAADFWIDNWEHEEHYMRHIRDTCNETESLQGSTDSMWRHSGDGDLKDTSFWESAAPGGPPKVSWDDVDFLSSLFPHIPSPDLAAFYAEYNRDVDDTISYILSRDQISLLSREAEEKHGSSSGEWIPARKNKARRDRKQKTVLYQSPTPVQQGAANHHNKEVKSPGTPQSANVSQNLSRVGKNSLSKPAANPWASLETHTAFLETMTGVPAARITSLFHQSGSAWASVVHILLKSLYDERGAFTNAEEDLVRECGAILPEKSPQRYRYLVAALQTRTLENVFMLNEKIEEIEGKERVDVFNAPLIVWDRTSLRIKPETSSKTKKSTSTKTTPTTDPDEESFDKNRSLEYCQRMVDLHTAKRDEAFRNASRYYQRGKFEGRGGCVYWSEVGREERARVLVWKEKAAFALVRERIVGNDIDLHNLPLNHALTVLRESLAKWWASSEPKQNGIKIITGAGNHSRDNKAILLPAVKRFLDREGWRWRPAPGYTPNSYNPGAIIVTGVR